MLTPTFEKVESAMSNVEETITQLVEAEPGEYKVATGDYNDITKARSALIEAGYVCRSRKTGNNLEVRVNRKGQDVDVEEYELTVKVTTASGRREPQPKAETNGKTDTQTSDPF